MRRYSGDRFYATSGELPTGLYQGAFAILSGEPNQLMIFESGVWKEISTSSGGGTIDGAGIANYVTVWQDSNTITTGIAVDDGTAFAIDGNLAVTGTLQVLGGTAQVDRVLAALDTEGNATWKELSSIQSSGVGGSGTIDYIPKWDSNTDLGDSILHQVTNNIVVEGGFSGHAITGTSLLISSLTSGSVPFIGLDGSVIEDNTNLFWDDTNNYLGHRNECSLYFIRSSRWPFSL